jgi:hypothetical protein
LILSSWFIQGKLSIGQALLSFLRGVSERTCITPEEYGLELAMTVLEDKVSVTARMRPQIRNLSPDPEHGKLRF